MLWVMTATGVFVFIEISLVEQPSFFWPLVIAVTMRLAWVWAFGNWTETPCQYGRCFSKTKKSKKGETWAIVHGEELLVCKYCYKYIYDERSKDHVIRQKNDF